VHLYFQVSQALNHLVQAYRSSVYFVQHIVASVRWCNNIT